MNIIFPFITRCTVFTENDIKDTPISKDIESILLLDHFYGFTGLHAIKRAVLTLADIKGAIRIISVDRYFLGQGFKPQYLLGSGLTCNDDASKGTELSILILDENTNLTPHIPVNMENYK